jgi:hypothetical protein
MAIDNTPPRLRLIATIAAIVVITLIGLDFVFKSYYGYMTDEARREKMAPTADYAAQVAAERIALSGAKMPLDQAAAQLKSSRGDLIEPKASDDLGAMTGWSKLPKQAPTAAHAVDTHAADAGAALPTATADGGAVNVGDAGAAPHTTDGGSAPKGVRAPQAAPNDAGARAPLHH